MKSLVRRHKAQLGSALPVVLALAMGVGALTAGYAMRNVRETQRDRYNEDSTAALYQAWAQMEVVTFMVNTSGYDGLGNNEAVSLALAQTPDPLNGNFIGPDGWAVGVSCERMTDVGGNPLPLFDIVSTATVGSATRRVSALVRERQSFADFNYFVASHPLGIAGGLDGTFPYSDAPEGSIHSNDEIVFYFPDRHFRDAVTAVNGFSYAAGAQGPDHEDGTNTHFHGPVNDASTVVTGLTDVTPADFGTRSDTLLNLDGEWDYAKVYLHGDQIEVQHWEKAHDIQVPSEEETVYGFRSFEPPQYRQVEERWRETYTRTWTTENWVQGEPYEVVGWHTETVEGGGTGATAGGGEEGGDVSYEVDVYGPYMYTPWVQGDPFLTEHSEERTRWRSYNPRRYRQGNEIFEEYILEVIPAGATVDTVRVPNTLIETHMVPAEGTIYVRGDIILDRMRTRDGRPHEVHVLDGRVTLASDDDIFIRDSIVYGRPDGSGDLQTAYLNGDNPEAEYTPNPAYTGNSVLGLLARDVIQYQRQMPDRAEINATMLSRNTQIYPQGLRVRSNGNIDERSGGWVKTSLRRLGGIISNRRPVTTYVNSDNEITRGFIFAKSVFDTRQRTTPPLGFPAVNRPRILATVMKEVQ